MEKNTTTWDPLISSFIISELKKRDEWIKRITNEFNLVTAECGKLRDRVNKLQRFEKKYVDLKEFKKEAGKKFEKKKFLIQHKNIGDRKVMNKDTGRTLKYLNANKVFMYFNKLVDEQLMNKVLEKLDNKKIAGVTYKDNGCVVTFYHKKDRDEVLESEVLNNLCFIDRGFFCMNACNLEFIVERERASEVILAIEQLNIKESIKSFTQRLLNKEDKNSRVVIRVGATNSAIKANMQNLKWIKINDLGKEKPIIKLHSKKLLNHKTIIQGVYNAWDKIMEEGNTPEIEDNDIMVKTAYTKTKKELRYNYLIQLKSFEVANNLFGQIIVVEGGNYKLENPNDRLNNGFTTNPSINEAIKTNNMEECTVISQTSNNDSINNFNNTPNMDTSIQTQNNNIQESNYRGNNYPTELNAILSKLMESNSFFCNTISNLSNNIEVLQKEIKVISNRVDYLECEGKRTRDIISEDCPMMLKSSKVSNFHQGLSQ